MSDLRNQVIAGVLSAAVGSLLTIIIGGVIVYFTLWADNRVIQERLAKVATLEDLVKRDVKIEATAEDLKYLRSQLPFARLASEELKKTVEVAVVTTRAQQTGDREWTSYVHLFDASSGKRTTFEVKLVGPDAKRIDQYVTGVVGQESKIAIPFGSMEEAATQTSTTLNFPAYVERQSSFAVRVVDAEKLKAEMSGILSVEGKVTKFESRDASWNSFAGELSQNAKKYRPK